jgi:hypothetical protein
MMTPGFCTIYPDCDCGIGLCQRDAMAAAYREEAQDKAAVEALAKALRETMARARAEARMTCA